MANGEVVSVWQKDSTSRKSIQISYVTAYASIRELNFFQEIMLVPFVENGVAICLAVDPEAYTKKYPGEKRAVRNLVFSSSSGLIMCCSKIHHRAH